jgi:uncharacterized protein (TIGR02246 family)
MKSDEQAIRDVISTWLEASKAGDNEKVLSLMTDDVVFLIPGHAPMRGKSGFAAAQGGMRPFEFEATSDIQEIRVMADWAYTWTHLTVVMTPKGGGDTVKRSGPTLSIFRKEAGRWLLARDANMLSQVV